VRSVLRSTLRHGALPFGYTLVTWTSGGVLIHGHGAPSLLDAYLFMLGALAGFATAALIAGRGELAEIGGGVASGLGAVVALASAGAAAAIPTRFAYFAVALVSTLAYYVVRASASLAVREGKTSRLGGAER
jgi:hypothetical protein